MWPPDVDARDKHGNSILLALCQILPSRYEPPSARGNVLLSKLLPVLLALGAAPNQQQPGTGGAALMHCSANWHAAGVQTLLAAGADPNICNENGWTTASAACTAFGKASGVSSHAAADSQKKKMKSPKALPAPPPNTKDGASDADSNGLPCAGDGVRLLMKHCVANLPDHNEDTADNDDDGHDEDGRGDGDGSSVLLSVGSSNVSSGDITIDRQTIRGQTALLQAWKICTLMQWLCCYMLERAPIVCRNLDSNQHCCLGCSQVLD